jgi:hypothetical protein
MKKLVQSILMSVAVVVLSANLSIAGQGKGPGNGTGPIHDIISTFTYSGGVVSLVRGQGLVVATDTGEVAIYGIGPYRYWREKGIDRPVVGDEITVEGYVVSFNGVERNIASAITTADGEIELRDADGKPLWKGNKGKKGKMGHARGARS